MKKTMQRLISVVLTLMLMMSLCAPIFSVSATEELTKVEEWNLILGDEIGAKFYVSVSDSVSSDAVMYVTDGYGTSQYALSEKDGDGNFVFTARLAAAQLADTITLQLHDGETLGPVHSYKAVDYAETIMEGNYSETTKALVKAMLNYGAAAQNYFDYNTENLANAGYEDTTLPEIPAVDTSNMVSGSVSGISYYGASLVFRSRVAVRFYFNVSGDINNFTFSTGSAPVLKNGMYYVEVTDIDPQEYENEIQLTVNDALTVTYSPLTYISRKAASDNTELAALVAAMYRYHLSAEAYVPETPIIEVTPTLIDNDDFRTNTDKAWMDFGSEYTGNFTPADDNSGVWFNGEKMAAPILQMNEWYTTYCSIYLGTVTAESTLKVDGIFVNEDGTKIQITDFNLKRVDGKWELDNGDTPEAEPIEVTPTLIDNDDFRTNTDKAWMDFGSEYTGNFTPADDNSGVWFNGEKMAAPILQMNEWYTTYCSIYLGTVTAESTLKVDGIFVNEDGTKIQITDFNLKRVDGKWELDNGDTPEAEPIEVTPTLIDNDDFRTNTDKAWMDFGSEYTGNFTPADDNSGVWFNDEKMAAPILQMNEWYTTYCSIYLGTVTAESTLKVDGIFVNEDGLKIKITDFNLKRVDGKWELDNGDTPEAEPIEVTPTLIDNDDFRTNTDKAWMDFGSEYTGNFTPADDNSGVWFNGEKMAAPILQMNAYYTTYCSIYLGTVTAESTLKVDGIFVNEDGLKIKITDFNLKRVDGKWELDNGSGSEEAPATVVTLTPNGQAGNANVVYVSLSDLTTNQKYSPAADGYVKLNGETLNNEYELDYVFTYAGWSDVHYIQLTHLDTSKDLTYAAGSVLTIGGTFVGAADGTKIYINEVSLICSSPTEPWTINVPLETVYNVTLTPHNDHNNTTTVYVSAVSDLTSSFEANKNFKPVVSNGVVSLNGVALEESADYCFMTAYNPNALYVIQLLNGRTWNIGDQLTVSGQFSYDGSTAGIAVAEYTMWYDGSVWTTEAPLCTPGDLNYDGDWTSADLELLQSYIDQGIADEYSAVADLNGDNAVNSDDTALLQSIIAGGSQVIDGKVTTKYRSNKKLNIFADGPVVQSNEDLLKAYFNAGFTTLIMTEDYTGVMGDDGNTGITKADGTLDDDYRNCIETALKYGDVMVRNHSNIAGYFTESLYSQLYDLGVRQFYIWDEPNPKNNGFLGIGSEEGDIPTVAALAESFEALLPADALFHVNLLPSYGAGNGSSWMGLISYTEYVDQYVNDVVSKLSTHEQTLSVDNYPLLSDNTIRGTYLRDLWYIGNKAKEAQASGSDITVNYCIQAYADPTNDEIRTPESRADISFQTNTGLALGAESFEYFEYYDYDASTETITGIVHNGLYEEVKSINKELNAWDHIFLSFDWQGVKTYNVDSAYTSGVTELSSLQGISGVTATAATLVGEYKYGDAAEYAYMITNFTEPSQGTTDTVTVTLSANQEVLVYADGIGRWLNADENGTLTLSIPAGGGVFVIPQ